MEFLCNSKILSQVVNNVCLTLIKKNNPISILDGILLECYSNELKLTTFNLNLAIIKKIKVQTLQEGKIILNAQLFNDILKKLNNSNINFQSNKNLQTTITDNETKFQLTGINANKFPKIFDIQNNEKITINQLDFKNMLYQTLFAIAPTSTQNPVLCGSLFKINNDSFQIISLDGYRVAITKQFINNFNIKTQFIISSKTLNEIFKILNEEETSKNIKINFNSKYASFYINGYEIYTKLLEGEFLNYKQAISQNYETILTINSKKLIESIEKISVMITNNVSIILKITDSKIELNCQSMLGTAKDCLHTKIKGKPIEKIAFNSKYMLDALKHTQCENVKICFNGALSPIKIIPEKNENFIFLVLPIRI